MPQAPPPGLTVGGYELRARLGEGGMGVVHLGQRPGERPVALKVLRPHIIGDDEARQRLAREVSSLSRVRSHRIAEIVDADPWGEIPYVATRYVPGLSLHDHVLEEGALTGQDLLWFADCLAEALEAVHSVGVLHRDIKPSNVVMEGRTPILIDFGLARVADDPRLTMTGWLLGTPGYLAPEILHGDDAVAASDVHAWAATVAYAGLARAPFGRGPSMAIMDRVRRGGHDLEGLDPDVRPLVEHALAPDPGQRPSLHEIREWLAHLSGRPGAPVSGFAAPAAAPVTAPLQTMPVSAAHFGDIVAPTEHRSPQPAYGPGAATTRTLPDGSTEVISREYVAGFDDHREPVGERLRRGLLATAGGLVVAAGVMAAPYVTVVVVCLLAWLLRSGSLAASSLRRRRQLRGLRWYDSSLALLSAPWHLTAAIGGTLLLALWSLGITLAAALLCFAVGLSLSTSLGVLGFTFAASMWSGPGGYRVRSPLSAAIRPASRSAVPWLVTLILVLALAAGVAGYASSAGTAWFPAAQAPFSGVDLPGWM